MTVSYTQDEGERLVCSQSWMVKIIVGHVSSITNFKTSESFLILFEMIIVSSS